MPSLLSLLDKQPSLPDATMSSEGYVLWLAWDGEPDANVTRILQDYGGLDVVRDTGQALWFFFTPDALLALARLTVWGKFNLLSMVVLAMPGVLRAGVGQTLFVSLDAALAGQEVQNPRPGLMIWIHPRVRDTGVNMPGLSFVPSSPEQNMVRAKWTILDADARLPYTSSQGWYAILRPLGNPLDKNFQNGWRNLFAVLETILRQGKWKYSLNDNFLMLPIDSLGQLRNWLRELLLALNRIREDSAQSYWPCVNAIVDRKGLNFNSELPQKVNITWDELMPDYPLVSYRNAYLLGHDFVIHDLYFSGAGTSILDWCTVGLRELSEREGSVPLLMAGQLVKGREHCFYCGARSHASGQCPSRVLPPLPGDFWRRYSDLDLDAINAAYRAIEQTLARSGTEGLRGLPGTGSPEGRVLEGLFALKNSVDRKSVV